MTDQIDPLEQLRAANPVDSYRMDPGLQEQMTLSVLSEPRSVRRHSVFRTWQAKTASAVAVAAALAAGAVVAFGGGATTPLAPLSISSIQNSTSGASHGPGNYPGHNYNTSFTFVPGLGLSSSASTAPVYSFAYAPDPTTEVTAIATTLGVANPHVVTGGNNGCGVEVGGDSSFVYTDCNPPTGWVFNLKLPPCSGVTKDAAGQVVPCPVAEGLEDSGATDAQLAQWSASAAASVAPSGLTLGSPTFGPDLNVATYPCGIDGVPIDGCAEIFWYSNAGNLAEASGPLSATGPYTQLGDYPLISPRDAVAGVKSDAVFHGSASPTTSTTVTLTNSTLVYEVATMSNGSTALVPAYSYTASNGGTYTAIAVSPSYVQGASPQG
jgi:hypothetical protein